MSGFDDLHFGVSSSSKTEEDGFCLQCLRLYRISITDRLCPSCGLPLRKFNNNNTSNNSGSSNSSSDTAPLSSSIPSSSSSNQVQSIRTLLEQMNQVLYQESERVYQQNQIRHPITSSSSSSSIASSTSDQKEEEDNDDDENDENNDNISNNIISRSQLSSGPSSLRSNTTVSDMMDQLLTMTLTTNGSTGSSNSNNNNHHTNNTISPSTIGLPNGIYDPVLLASLESTMQSFMESLPREQTTVLPEMGGNGNGLFFPFPSSVLNQPRIDAQILASLPRIKINNPSTDLPHNYSLQLIVPNSSSTNNNNNSSVNIPLDFSALPANFGPTLHRKGTLAIEGYLVPVEPLNAAVDVLSNGNMLTNAIAIVERGVVSFALKAKYVSNYGAKALIVINGKNMAWPYTMTDSTGEGSTIPLVMVRYEDGERLLNYCRRNPSCSSNGKLLAAPSSESCPICYDTFTKDSTVLTLPCQHIFDEVCGLKWLETHNSCPICRSTLPTTSSTTGPNDNTSNSNLFHQMQNDLQRQRQQQQGNNNPSNTGNGNGWYQ